MPPRCKIAALPPQIREEMNRRLADVVPGADILAWLNELPEVRAMLAEHFGGVPISPANLSLWVDTGFSRWIQEQDNREFVAEIARQAAVFSDANQSSIASGALALISARLISSLPEDALSQPLPTVALVRALVAIRSTENDHDRNAVEKEKLQLRQRQLDLVERRVKVIEKKAKPPPKKRCPGLSPEVLAKMEEMAKIL